MNDYMTAEQVATAIGISRTALARLINRGKFPRATHRKGLRLLWLADVVAAHSRIELIGDDREMRVSGERRG